MRAIAKIVQADKAGYSLRVTVPSELVDKMKLQPGDSLEFDWSTGEEATIRKVK